MTPDWTPELLDEEGRRAGRAMSWAKAARAGEFKKDPYESMNIEGGLQVYSIFSVLFTTFAYGRASREALTSMNMGGGDVDSFLSSLQVPALTVVIAALGSSILCSFLAQGKNRNGFVWGVKGFAGGPIAILQLRGLGELKTRGEIEKEALG